MERLPGGRNMTFTRSSLQSVVELCSGLPCGSVLGSLRQYSRGLVGFHQRASLWRHLFVAKGTRFGTLYSLLLVCFGVVLGLLGCGANETESHTGVVVSIWTSSEVEGVTGRVRAVIEGAASADDLDGKRESLYGKTWDMPRYPLRVTLQPADGDANRYFVLTATALDGEGVVAEGRVAGSYIPGEARHVNLVLQAGCLEMPCAALETCREGVCDNALVAVETLPSSPWVPELDGGAEQVNDGGAGAADESGGSGGAGDDGALCGGEMRLCERSGECIPASGCCGAQDCTGGMRAQVASCEQQVCTYRAGNGWVDAGLDAYGEWAVLEVSGVPVRMRYIEAGSFLMGSPENEEGREADESQHMVTLTRGFWLAETETTQELWSAVMGDNPSNFEGPKRPVEHVSWEDVQGFFTSVNALVAGAGLRLPTEAEWEYGCRAGTSGNWYANLDDAAWWSENSGDETHVAGSKLANVWGLRDMLGNVNEWCSDWYGDYPSSEASDPPGPETGSGRVARGGSWTGLATNVRAANRYKVELERRSYSLGFRIARASVEGE